MKIAVCGFAPHKWVSVERTRQFYERTLSKSFDWTSNLNWKSNFSNHNLDAIINFTGRIGWNLNPRPNCPLIFALHGGPVIDYSFLAERLPRFQKNDLFIVNCKSDQAILRFLVANNNIRTAVLPLPINVSIFCPQDRVLCRLVMPFKSDYVLGFVSRVLPQKNLHAFLDILAQVKSRLAPKTVHGVIVGNYWVDYPVLPFNTSSYPQIIKKLIDKLNLRNDITFLSGQLTSEQLAMCYGGIDVLVHPTNAIDENFGYGPIEAMACGTPVVGAAYGGLKDSILDGVTGYLIPTWVTNNGIRMDLITAVNCIISLLTDKKRHKMFSDFAIKHASTTYNELTCEKILRDAIKSAVVARQSDCKPQLPLTTKRPLSGITTFSSGLPNTTPSWQYYHKPACFYVSQDRPEASKCKLFRLASPVHIKKSGCITLLDPAWPASSHLDDTELLLVKNLQSHGICSFSKLRELSAIKSILTFVTKLQRLVDIGVVIGSKLDPL